MRQYYCFLCCFKKVLLLIHMIDGAVGKFIIIFLIARSAIIWSSGHEALVEPVPLRLRELTGKLVCMNREPTSLYA